MHHRIRTLRSEIAIPLTICMTTTRPDTSPSSLDTSGSHLRHPLVLMSRCWTRYVVDLSKVTFHPCTDVPRTFLTERFRRRHYHHSTRLDETVLGQFLLFNNINFRHDKYLRDQAQFMNIMWGVSAPLLPGACAAPVLLF